MQSQFRHQIIQLGMALIVSVGLWFSGDGGRWALAIGVLFVVPGWWWQRLWPLVHIHWVGRLMMQMLIGPAVIVIVYAWAAWFDVPLPVRVMWWGLAGLTLAMAWLVRWPTWTGQIRTTWWPITAGIIMGLVIMTRWLHVDGIVLPPWVDGVHHALLVRVAVEQSHAAVNVMPYVPVTQLMYHTGWHSVMAFVWSIHASSFVHLGAFLLGVGQGWNVLAVVSVAGLVWYWWRSWPATIVACILVGLVSVMPAYYLSWGRYTLLAGMAWLPVMMVATELVWHEHEDHRWMWIVPLMSGLLFVHMVVGVMVVVWGLVMWWYHGRLVRGWYLLVGGVVACMLPWLVLSWAQITWAGGTDASARYVVGNRSHNAFIPGLFWARHHVWLLPLALLSAWAMIRRRQVQIALVVVWWAMIVALANPVVVGLPYLSFFTNEIWITALYVPLALVVARAVVHVQQRWMCVGLLVVAVGAFGQMQHIVRQETIMTNQADVQAMTWIDAQLRDDVVFLTNTTEWMWHVDRGSDGGWWIMPLTGRATTTPPVLFTYAEANVAQALYQQTTRIRQIQTAAALAEWLAANPAITHVYATRRGTITPEMVAQLPQAVPVYTTGDVAIYAVSP
jgi:hypothetical protein